MHCIDNLETMELFRMPIQRCTPQMCALGAQSTGTSVWTQTKNQGNTKRNAAVGSNRKKDGKERVLKHATGEGFLYLQSVKGDVP